MNKYPCPGEHVIGKNNTFDFGLVFHIECNRNLVDSISFEMRDLVTDPTVADVWREKTMTKHNIDWMGLVIDKLLEEKNTKPPKFKWDDNMLAFEDTETGRRWKYENDYWAEVT